MFAVEDDAIRADVDVALPDDFFQGGVFRRPIAIALFQDQASDGIAAVEIILDGDPNFMLGVHQAIHILGDALQDLGGQLGSLDARDDGGGRALELVVDR